MSTKPRRARKQVTPLPQGLPDSAVPGIIVPFVGGTPEVSLPPGVSGAAELEYKTLLQEAIIWATKQILDECRADILARAEARVKTLQELRG